MGLPVYAQMILLFFIVIYNLWFTKLYIIKKMNLYTQDINLSKTLSIWTSCNSIGWCNLWGWRWKYQSHQYGWKFEKVVIVCLFLFRLWSSTFESFDIIFVFWEGRGELVTKKINSKYQNENQTLLKLKVLL